MLSAGLPSCAGRVHAPEQVFLFAWDTVSKELCPHPLLGAESQSLVLEGDSSDGRLVLFVAVQGLLLMLWDAAVALLGSLRGFCS